MGGVEEGCAVYEGGGGCVEGCVVVRVGEESVWVALGYNKHD